MAGRARFNRGGALPLSWAPSPCGHGHHGMGHGNARGSGGRWRLTASSPYRPGLQGILPGAGGRPVYRKAVNHGGVSPKTYDGGVRRAGGTIVKTGSGSRPGNLVMPHRGDHTGRCCHISMPMTGKARSVKAAPTVPRAHALGPCPLECPSFALEPLVVQIGQLASFPRICLCGNIFLLKFALINP